MRSRGYFPLVEYAVKTCLRECKGWAESQRQGERHNSHANEITNGIETMLY
jgi:hypothetical protein